MEKRYNTLSSELRRRYGSRLGKICIDGGFTCPNRDGTCGTGGCIFCGERGSGEHITPSTIENQVRSYLASPAASKFGGYIAYFQNFTNTYEDPGVLRGRYSEALVDPRIRVLSVGTRPDCVDRERADVLAEFLQGRDVWCELGLQSASDKTARFINRGYDTARFGNAVDLLRSRGIEVIAHIIIGLPNGVRSREGERELAETVRLINSLPVSGVKIHSLYVMKQTRLCELYESGGYEPLSLEEYVSLASFAICRLRPDIVLHRVTGDCPRALLAAPSWNAYKTRVISSLDSYLEAHGLYQGCLCK